MIPGNAAALPEGHADPVPDLLAHVDFRCEHGEDMELCEDCPG